MIKENLFLGFHDYVDEDNPLELPENVARIALEMNLKFSKWFTF